MGDGKGGLTRLVRVEGGGEPRDVLCLRLLRDLALLVGLYWYFVDGSYPRQREYHTIVKQALGCVASEGTDMSAQ